MVLSAWIMVVPSASASFAFGLFEKEWTLSTPGELKPEGWKAVDFWAPVVIAWLYGALTHAQPVFLAPYTLFGAVIPGMGITTGSTRIKTGSVPGQTMTPFEPWDKLDARALCAVVLAVLFALRAIYNFGETPQGTESKVVRGEKGEFLISCEPYHPVRSAKIQETNWNVTRFLWFPVAIAEPSTPGKKSKKKSY